MERKQKESVQGKEAEKKSSFLLSIFAVVQVENMERGKENRTSIEEFIDCRKQ